jgi:hypothetical protein
MNFYYPSAEKDKLNNEINLQSSEIDRLNKENDDIKFYCENEIEKKLIEYVERINKLEDNVEIKERKIEDLEHKLKISDANIRDISEHFERDKSAYLRENEIERNDYEYLKSQLEQSEKALKKLKNEIEKKNSDVFIDKFILILFKVYSFYV